MALVGQRYLMAIGGNDGMHFSLLAYSQYFMLEHYVLLKGPHSELFIKPLGKRPLADVWALDTAAKPYEWRKLEPEGEGPPPCM